MARLRRWNIINKSEDCEPEDGAGVAGGEAGKGPPKTGDTKALLFKSLKVRRPLVPAWGLAGMDGWMDGACAGVACTYPLHIPTCTQPPKSMQGNYLFSELPDADLESTASAMKRVAKQPGDIIIRQGHKGTEFFILEKGRADV